MTDPVNVSVIQEVTSVNIENAPDQLRNIVTVDEDTTDVFVQLLGAPGPRGYGLESGSGAPTSSVGRDGDFYVNIDNVFIYGPKANGVWPSEPIFIPGGTRRQIHTQASPSDTWTINHTLGGYPSVTVVDSASTVVIGEVLYVSTSQVVVEFTSPFSGFAYLT